MRTAIQLYTLRALEESVPELLARVGETSFDGVEFAGLGDASTDAVAAALDDAGLDAMAAHVGIDALESDLGGVVETYRTIGCDHLVVPYLPPAAFRSREAVTETARRLAAVSDRVRDRGLALSYHNHVAEFREVDGDPAFAVLAEEAPSLAFELDAGWALAGGHDPADLLRAYGDRVPLVHLKDVVVGAGSTGGGNGGDAGGTGDGTAGRYTTDAHRPVELGAGDLDVERVADAARDVGAEWVCYEHDQPDDPLASLRHGSDRLARLY